MIGEGLEGKELLVVGPGRIGRRVAELAEAHGARVRFAGRDDDLIAALAAADVVSLHCPLTPDTRHLVDAGALGAMKPTAVLVNTARGPVVDERRALAALSAGTIAGAALDVFEHEPAVSEELLAMENVVLTPHIASATARRSLAMGMLCVSAFRAVSLRADAAERGVASCDGSIRLCVHDRQARACARPASAPRGRRALACVRLACRPRRRGRVRRARAFCGLLEAAGAEVVVSRHDPGNPDAIYVYDPVLVGSRGAVLLRPGKEGSRSEPAAIAPTP